MDDTVDRKVLAIFQELVGGRATQIEVAIPTAQQTIAKALASEHSAEVARDIAFHLTDWNSDAAFIVAVTLFPERFSPEEIQEGVLDFIVHAPNHIAAAAKLGNFPVADIFGVGALDRCDDM